MKLAVSKFYNRPLLIQRRDRGYALLTTMMMVLVMGIMLATYHSIASLDLATLKSSARYEKSFYAAEASLNARAEEFRQIFTYHNLPVGVNPNQATPCSGSNNGTGDYACKSYVFAKNSAKTYVIAKSATPVTVTIPQGEPYAGLYAQEYSYDVFSTATRADGSVGAKLGLRFKSRVVPMYQFAAFYNKDLEITPIANMVIGGPIHSNGNLYLNTSATLTINGQITTVGDIYRGRKAANDCYTGTIRVAHEMPSGTLDPSILTSFAVNSQYSCATGNTRKFLGNNSFSPWNGMIHQHVGDLDVPNITEFDPVAGAEFWDLSDLRLVLRVNASGTPITTNSPTGIEARTQAGTVQTAITQKINRMVTTTCAGPAAAPFNGRPIGTSNTMYNEIDGGLIRMLEVDMGSLLKCLHDEGLVALNDTTNKGLVFHLTVEGPSSGVINRYGVRIRNGATLAATGAPAIEGLTIVSDQAMYIYGNYNSVNKKPAALISDSLNVISSAWVDGYSPTNYTNRIAVNTTVNAAVVAGTITTGGAEGVAGHNLSPNSAGVNNFARLHENWTGKTLTILGSFVSLSTPRYSNGSIVSGGHFAPPTRNFDFDLDYNNPINLPPVSISFVYLKQILFSRDFEI